MHVEVPDASHCTTTIKFLIRPGECQTTIMIIDYTQWCQWGYHNLNMHLVHLDFDSSQVAKYNGQNVIIELLK